MTTTIRPLAVCAALLAASAPAFADHHGDKKAAPVFSKATADFGIVVKDIEASAKFYSEVVGLTEVKGFSVPGEKAKAIGLTDNKAVNVRVFVLNKDAEHKSSFKLMSFPDAPGKAQDQKFIHSTLGISYLTLFVNDMPSCLERLKKAGVELLGETPAPIGGKNYITVFRDPDGTFIELIGPME